MIGAACRALVSYTREAMSLQQQQAGEATFWEVARAFPAWLRSLRRCPIADERPWMTFSALRFLDRILRPDMRVYEYGVGGSTLYLARRVETVISVEHDPTWCARVGEELRWRGLTKCLLRCVPPTPRADALDDPSDPDAYASSEEQFRGSSFRDYAASIDEFADGHFDLVLVDGRARPSCIKHARAKVKPGGFLVLDNADRKDYFQAQASLAEPTWRKRTFAGPGPYNRYFWKTCAWERLL